MIGRTPASAKPATTGAAEVDKAAAVDEEQAAGAPSSRSAVSTEDALARALEAAALAGRWDVVAALARELEARRLAGDAQIVSLGRRRV
ncbi:MAG: hypothetical protein JNL38_03780 [Myxococcales bacterium]|nr:hypothetical protein [Myxococcales bacterium]